MSKYDEIVEMAKQATLDIRNYQRVSIEFVEILAAEWGNYLETGVAIVSTSNQEVKQTFDALDITEEGWWKFALALSLFPRGEFEIPLLFKKGPGGFKIQIVKDAQNKTFPIKKLEPEAFIPFFDYLFANIQRHFGNFKYPSESRPILGFSAARLLKTNLPDE